MDTYTVEKWMDWALSLAKEAGKRGEVPVAALVLRQGEIIASGANARQTQADPLAHAEIAALRAAAERLGSWNLSGCDLVVTLEPCAMCTGAILQAHISRIVFGAYDAKAGCCGSVYNLPEDERFPARAQVIGGIRQEASAALLNAFFKERRP